MSDEAHPPSRAHGTAARVGKAMVGPARKTGRVLVLSDAAENPTDQRMHLPSLRWLCAIASGLAACFLFAAIMVLVLTGLWASPRMTVVRGVALTCVVGVSAFLVYLAICAARLAWRSKGDAYVLSDEAIEVIDGNGGVIARVDRRQVLGVLDTRWSTKLALPDRTVALGWLLRSSRARLAEHIRSHWGVCVRSGPRGTPQNGFDSLFRDKPVIEMYEVGCREQESADTEDTGGESP